jgi:dihydropteroate synthase
MDARDYWYRLVRANPAMRDEDAKLTISVRSLRKQIEKAFEEGAESVPDSDGGGFFDGIFGSGKHRGR